MSLIIAPDLSHHNQNSSLANTFLAEGNLKYAAFKLTEGITYIDNYIDTYIDQLLYHTPKSYKVVIGLYHFCRLDNKLDSETAAERAQKEMKHYISTFREKTQAARQKYPHHNFEFVTILDWEGASLKAAHGDDYLCECIARIYGAFGVAPILYMSASTTKNLYMATIKIRYPDVPLWVAHYGVNSPVFGTWRAWLGWQFTSTPIDLSFIDIGALYGYTIDVKREAD